MNENQPEPDDINIEVPLPSLQEINAFKKEFEKLLKWRKRNKKERINPYQFQQEIRILRETQEILNMKYDRHFAALVLDRRHYQSASIFENAATLDPPTQEEPKRSNIKNYSYFTRSSNLESDSDDDNSYKPRSFKKVVLATRIRSPDVTGTYRSSFFQPTPETKFRPRRF